MSNYSFSLFSETTAKPFKRVFLVYDSVNKSLNFVDSSTFRWFSGLDYFSVSFCAVKWWKVWLHKCLLLFPFGLWRQCTKKLWLKLKNPKIRIHSKAGNSNLAKNFFSFFLAEFDWHFDFFSRIHCKQLLANNDSWQSFLIFGKSHVECSKMKNLQS